MPKKETENKKSTKAASVKKTTAVKKAKETDKSAKNETTNKVTKSTKTAKKPTSTKSTTKKTTSAKKVESSSEVAKKSSRAKSVKKVETAATTTKKTTRTKPASKAKSSTKDTKKVSSRKKSTSTEKAMLSEYYDLPYSYNETTVKILAQTPTTLFVYWDISEEDRNNLIKQYGDNFFYETRPILIVHNTTKNYSFEIEINDFANSWYIRCQEPNCDYVIELGRKIIQKPDQYIYIDSSNEIVSPNDHILFENINLGNVLFRNAKTGVLSSKDFGSLRFLRDFDKIYGNIYDIYEKLYKNENLSDFVNPSSGEFILR